MNASRTERPSKLLARRPGARIVSLAPARRARTATAAARDPNRCGKCGSTFIAHEPAFVHCRYCGNMSRIHGGSLLAQQEFEVRSGLRLAS